MYNNIKNENVDTLLIEIDKKEFKIFIDYTSFLESESNLDKVGNITFDDREVNKDNKKENIDVKDVKLMFHDPQFVVKLQSELFPVCFGYLVFPKYLLNQQSQISDQAINDICLSILKNLENKIPGMEEFKNNRELKDIISTIVRGTDYGANNQMSIRFVPSDKMQHFKVPSIKYFPYGESIFEPITFLGKVLISLETALTIQRLSRSTEKRLIGIEIGLPREAKNLIESTKEQFRKRKICLDSFGTVDTIPSMITTFEDIYIPQKDGKKFVEISPLTEGNVDVRNKVEELKFIRDSLAASMGVPPALIGIEENAVVKATLSEENLLFARTVITHQKYLTVQVVDLIHKIFQLINPEDALTLLDNVLITLPTPKTLQFELLSRRMNDTISLIENLRRENWCS